MNYKTEWNNRNISIKLKLVIYKAYVVLNLNI